MRKYFIMSVKILLKGAVVFSQKTIGIHRKKGIQGITLSKANFDRTTYDIS
jgi:ribosomal protein S6E (S10)